MRRVPSLLATERTAVRADATDPDLRIFKTNIYVRDQDRSLDFYVNQLGFDLVADARFTQGTRWVAVAPPNGSAILALMAAKPGSAEEALIGRDTHLAFITEDIQGTYDCWHARGVQFMQQPTYMGWGGTLARFEDVDGNQFELLASADMNREIEALRKESLHRLETERRAIQELEIARDVQARLFPQRRPAMRTLDYAGLCIQARKVGGDYYDFLSLNEDRLGLLVGDVSGKGIAAALLMANLQANVRGQTALALDCPENMLTSVNQIFYANSTEGAYATLFFAEYVDSQRLLRYANCGHLPGLLLRCDGRLERLDTTCTVLGLFGEWACCPMREYVLNEGDILLLYTDGVTECFNEAEEEFGEERLIAALRQNRDRPVQEMVEVIADEVRRFGSDEQSDDITLIVARVRQAGNE